MTQARNFSKSTTTLSEDNFIIDDGNTTLKNGIDKIKNIYHFLIGSCILLNEIENVVYDENNLRKITYIKKESLLINAPLEKVVSITLENINNWQWGGGYNDSVYVLVNKATGEVLVQNLNATPIDTTGEYILANVISSNESQITFDFNFSTINRFDDSVLNYNYDYLNNSYYLKNAKQAVSVIDGKNVVNIMLTSPVQVIPAPGQDLDAIFVLDAYDPNSLLAFFQNKETVGQGFTLETFPFGVKNYDSSSIVLEDYPKLKEVFDNRGITKFQDLKDINQYFGYCSTFQESFYQEEDHSHKVIVTLNNGIAITNYMDILVNMNTGQALGEYKYSNIYKSTIYETVSLRVSYDWKSFDASYKTLLTSGAETRVASLSLNVYILADIKWM